VKNFYNFKIVLITFLFLGSCGDQAALEFKPVSIETVTPATSPGCSCSGASDVFARNNTDYEIRARIRKSEIVNGQTVQTSTDIKTIMPSDRKFLGCSRNTPKNDPVNSNSCRQENRYEVLGHEEANLLNRLKLVQFAYAANDSDLAKLVDIGSPPKFDCKLECLDPFHNNGLCFKASFARSQTEGFSDLRNELLKTDDGSIEKRHIMDWFGQSSDACNRSDLRIKKDGQVTNDGDACVLETAIGGVSGRIVSTIYMPAELSGSLKKSNDSLTLSFPNAGERFSLKISDAALNSDYGGPIWELFSDEIHFIAKTENGCVLQNLVSNQ